MKLLHPVKFYQENSDPYPHSVTYRIFRNALIVTGYLRTRLGIKDVELLHILLIGMITDLYGKLTAPIYAHPHINKWSLLYIRSDLLPEDMQSNSKQVVPINIYFIEKTGLAHLLRHYLQYKEEIINIVTFFYELHQPKVMWLPTDNFLWMETKDKFKMLNLGYFESNLGFDAFGDLFFYCFQEQLRSNKKAIVEWLD